MKSKVEEDQGYNCPGMFSFVVSRPDSCPEIFLVGQVVAAHRVVSAVDLDLDCSLDCIDWVQVPKEL